MLLKTKAELDAAMAEASTALQEAVRPVAERYADRGIRYFGMLVGVAEETIGVGFATSGFGNVSRRILHEVMVAELEASGAAIAIGITPENAEAIREIKEDLEKKVSEGASRAAGFEPATHGEGIAD